MAREAQLLITVGSGGVRSVGMFKAKSHKVIKGTDYPFVWVKSIYHMIVKREAVSHARGAPERQGPKVFGPGCFVGANVE